MVNVEKLVNKSLGNFVVYRDGRCLLPRAGFKYIQNGKAKQKCVNGSKKQLCIYKTIATRGTI